MRRRGARERAVGHYQCKCGRHYINDATSYRADAKAQTRRDCQRFLRVRIATATVDDGVRRYKGVREKFLRRSQSGILQIRRNCTTLVASFRQYQNERV